MQYRFDKFVVDTAQLYLTADGEPVEADARQLQLLSLLIREFPECCERPALLEQLWPNTVVSQWSLARLVSDTRKLFREAGYQGPLIQTLHGRGYRLSPELAEQLHEIPAPTTRPDVPSELPEHGRHPIQKDTAPDGADDIVVDENRAPPPGDPDVVAEPFEPERPEFAPSKPDRAASILRSSSFWRLWLGMSLLVLVTALVVYLITARQIPDGGAPLVIGEAPDVRGRILWVDDNPENNVTERAQFESLRIAVYIVTNTEDALTLLSMYRYDAVISDMGRGAEPLAGFKLMERMRSRRDQTPYFLYTIMPSDAQRELVRRRGGNGVAVASDELFRLVLPLFDLPGTDLESAAPAP